MAQTMEFSGRLTRSDKRPANPGRYDLQFGIHGTAADAPSFWQEVVRGVDIVPGGFFKVVLGRGTPLEPELFEEGPRWLSVRIVRGRVVDDETAPRVPVSGELLSLEARVGALEERVEAGELSDAVREQIEALEARLESVEGELESSDLALRVQDLSTRLKVVDAEEGRLTRIEDELEDLIGPDGDVVDLNERMDRIEGQAPDLIASLRAREAEMSRERISQMRKEVDQLTALASGLRELLVGLRVRVEAVADRALPTPEALGAVSRQGDVMTGGLTINRGGLEVLSGGVTCRGATVNSLEASNQIKAPKVIADAIELRGDFTVDNTRRAIQVRLVEGRQGSARKDGALFLNGRSGAEVVVGTEAEAKGIQVHGPVTGRSFQSEDVGVAQAFEVYGSIEPGQVACMRPDGSKVEFSKELGDRAVIGVCVAQAGLSLGGSTVGGKALVVLHGVAMVQVDGGETGIEVGDLLVAGPDGLARVVTGPGLGAVLGKALGPLSSGRGQVAVLVGAR